MERSLIIIKPDAVCKGRIGEVIGRIEKKGFIIRALKIVRLTKKKAEEFYGIYRGMPFFKGLVKFMISAPSVMMVVEGRGVIKKMRERIGARVPSEAKKRTIRGDLASDDRRNIIHGSDSRKNAAREIKIFFKPNEIYKYDKKDWLNSEPDRNS